MSRRRAAASDSESLRSGGAQAARLASDSGNFLSAARNLTIDDAEFNNVRGHRTNFVINLNQNSPAQSPSRTGITSDYPSMASSHRNTRTNPLRPSAPQTSATRQLSNQQSNVIYQRNLELKGHGFPLWIPPANQNLPIQYRRTGVRIGDVGIITPNGAFSFLFNICLPRDDPVNQRSLPEHFSPISAAPSIDKFPEFGHGSHLASTSIEKTQANSQSLGFQFESSASEGAILTMPLGATSESLGNVASFRRYAASNMVHWYRFVNIDLGREAKNGDIRLVIGCVKTKSWGIATFANQSRQSSCRLRFGPSSDSSSSDSSRYFWEYSGTADVRAGPSPGENDGLRQVDDSGDVVYENQCLFLRTLNATLPDNIWSEIHHDPGSGDLQFESGFHPAKDSVSKATSTNRTSATKAKPDTLSSHGWGNRRSLDPHSELQNSTVRFDDKPAVLDSNPLSSLISHPSKGLNDILMEMVPAARMVITQDDDWSSVASKYDTVPNPHELLEQILVSRCIFEEDGIIFLDRRETIEGSVSNVQGPVFESLGDILSTIHPISVGKDGDGDDDSAASPYEGDGDDDSAASPYEDTDVEELNEELGDGVSTCLINATIATAVATKMRKIWMKKRKMKTKPLTRNPLRSSTSTLSQSPPPALYQSTSLSSTNQKQRTVVPAPPMARRASSGRSSSRSMSRSGSVGVGTNSSISRSKSPEIRGASLGMTRAASGERKKPAIAISTKPKNRPKFMLGSKGRGSSSEKFVGGSGGSMIIRKESSAVNPGGSSADAEGNGNDEKERGEERMIATKMIQMERRQQLLIQQPRLEIKQREDEQSALTAQLARQDADVHEIEIRKQRQRLQQQQQRGQGVQRGTNELISVSSKPPVAFNIGSNSHEDGGMGSNSRSGSEFSNHIERLMIPLVDPIVNGEGKERDDRVAGILEQEKRQPQQEDTFHQPHQLGVIQHANNTNTKHSTDETLNMVSSALAAKVLTPSESENEDSDDDGSWSNEEMESEDEQEGQRVEQQRHDQLLAQQYQQQQLQGQFQQQQRPQQQRPQQLRHRPPPLQLTHSTYHPTADHNHNFTHGANRTQRTQSSRGRRPPLNHSQGQALMTKVAQEAQQQRDMFAKKPTESFQNLTQVARTQSVSLLTQLMNPNPEIFPVGHPYRRGYGSSEIRDADIGDRDRDRGFRLPQPLMDVKATKTDIAQDDKLHERPPPSRPEAEHRKSSSPSVHSRATAALSPPARTLSMQMIKSTAAMPVSSQVQAGSVSTQTSNPVVGGPGAVNGFGMTNMKVTVNSNHSSGGYRPKGPPQDQELEDESGSEGESGSGMQVSKSVAQEKLKALAEWRGIIAHGNQPTMTTNGASTNRKTQLGDEDDVPAPPTLTRSHNQYPQSQAPDHNANRRSLNAFHFSQMITSTTNDSIPIPIGHPYNLPTPGLPSTPRTTRRLMLSTELSESLRRNLLWERQVSKVNRAAAVRRTASSGGGRHSLLGGVQPLMTTPNMVQLLPKGTMAHPNPESPVRPEQAQQGGGGIKKRKASAGADDGPGPSVYDEDEREERRGLAMGRNHSWANDYHFAGW